MSVSITLSSPPRALVSIALRDLIWLHDDHAKLFLQRDPPVSPFLSRKKRFFLDQRLSRQRNNVTPKASVQCLAPNKTQYV